MSTSGWVGVDLDGTLAIYDGWQGVEHIGLPVPVMLERVKRWIAEGHQVKILTARVSSGNRGLALPHIEAWLVEHLGHVIEVTHEKDFGMIELWDDRCVQVIANTGEPVGTSTRGLT